MSLRIDCPFSPMLETMVNDENGCQVVDEHIRSAGWVVRSRSFLARVDFAEASIRS